MIFLFILLVSCASPEELIPATTAADVWVCHNPGHELHGHACLEEAHALRGLHQPCYWETSDHHNGADNKDPDSFCWLLERKDCEEIEFEWQAQNCHFFD